MRDICKRRTTGTGWPGLPLIPEPDWHLLFGSTCPRARICRALPAREMRGL
jgi:hypothetical protein